MSKVSKLQTSLHRISSISSCSSCSSWVTRAVRSSAGISVLDIVITVFVLTLLLIAAANQFGSYEQSAPAEQTQEQPAS